MEQEHAVNVPASTTKPVPNVWTTVTPFSKYLAMALFIILPFLGGYVGYVYAPETVVEVAVIKEVDTDAAQETEVAPMQNSAAEQMEDIPPAQTENYATTTIDQGVYTLQLTPASVRVIDTASGQPTQVLEWAAYNFADYSRDLQRYVITEHDINYDGYLDLGVLQTIGQGSDFFYGFYVYDPEQNLLLRENTLGNGFETEGKTIVNPSFDIENKSVTSCQMGPVALKEYRCQSFVFTDQGYVSDEQWTESWDNQRSYIPYNEFVAVDPADFPNIDKQYFLDNPSESLRLVSDDTGVTKAMRLDESTLLLQAQSAYNMHIAFLLYDEVNEKVIREVAFPALSVYTWYNNATLVYVGGEANKIILKDYLTDTSTVLYAETDPSVQLVEVWELGQRGYLDVRNGQVVFPRYQKLEGTTATEYIEEVHVPVPQPFISD